MGVHLTPALTGASRKYSRAAEISGRPDKNKQTGNGFHDCTNVHIRVKSQSYTNTHSQCLLFYPLRTITSNKRTWCTLAYSRTGCRRTWGAPLHSHTALFTNTHTATAPSNRCIVQARENGPGAHEEQAMVTACRKKTNMVITQTSGEWVCLQQLTFICVQGE